MRELRLVLVGTVTLVLLGGLSGTALAQDEEATLDPLGPNAFTLTTGDLIYESEWVWSPGPDDSAEFLGVEAVFPIQSSDPRISGTWREVYDFRGWEDPDSGMPFSPAVYSAAVYIDNEDGAWVGTYDGFASGSNGQQWVRLQGEGAHEGLTALIHQRLDFETGAETYEGVIVPGALPDHPDPVTAWEPPAE